MACSSLLILLSLQYLFHLSLAAASCTPSSCGVIRNISYPFRLKNDPTHCGDRRFELACENNVTSLYLNSQRYFVKDIIYSSYTMRIVDASINNNDICSFPSCSALPFNFYPHLSTKTWMSISINFISCPNPLESSSLFKDITHDCNSSNPSRLHTYVKLGPMFAPDLPHMCELDLVAMTSWPEFINTDLNNVSLSEIHQSLLYGFELSLCAGCGQRLPTSWGPLLIIPVVAAVGPPVMALIGFTAVVGLIFFIGHQLFYFGKWGPGFDPLNSRGGSDALSTGFFSSIMMVCASRLITYPIIMCFLIYKFRRRYLSEFEIIESFLQSESKLIPIRYSYSHIQKMTKGFREKLGEGGYGSVYKGKLRSGNYVAVKMLGKSKANGQDFINEIATIGRIHHVNVVNLVGYCAEGSKRALVFDFMPNGSLEKYIFNRENKNILSWDKKFEIEVGVARGIEYLHRGCDIQILHFDIKPHNILLDDKFIPKVSDFGLAKCCLIEKNTMTMTAARGTIGYVAPELINRSIGRVSYKADVYSFGMLLMEMVGLNRDTKEKNDDSSKYFPCWIYDSFTQGMDIAMENVDGNSGRDVQKLARKMTIVALWCIQMNPDDRPSMNKVLDMLETDVVHLKVLEYPSQSAHMPLNEDDSWGTCSTNSLSLLHHNVSLPIVKIRFEE